MLTNENLIELDDLKIIEVWGIKQFAKFCEEKRNIKVTQVYFFPHPKSSWDAEIIFENGEVFLIEFKKRKDQYTYDYFTNNNPMFNSTKIRAIDRFKRDRKTDYNKIFNLNITSDYIMFYNVLKEDYMSYLDETKAVYKNTCHHCEEKKWYDEVYLDKSTNKVVTTYSKQILEEALKQGRVKEVI